MNPILLLVVLFGVPYGLEQLAYLRYARRPKRIARVAHPYSWRYVWDLAQLVGLAACAWRVLSSSAPFSAWEGAGYVLFLGGVAVRIAALRELGDNYDYRIAILANHRVVDTGVYRFLRHPLHLGTIQQIVGLACFAPVWLGGLLMVAAIATALYLNRLEDQILLNSLAAYRAYYDRTWDIVDIMAPKIS